MSSSVSRIAPQSSSLRTHVNHDQPLGSTAGRFDSPHSRLQPSEAAALRPTGLPSAHVMPAVPGMSAVPKVSSGTSPVRQRFYPAQLRRLLGLDLQLLAGRRQTKLHWIGWDRSLPRMYLPVEPLARLLIEAIDGITQKSDVGSGAAAVVLRVRTLPGTQPLLQVAIESPQWSCDPRFRGALNARWFRRGSQAHLWQRLARQCDQVGGWLSVASVPGGGAALLVHLPTDQPRCLIQSWLTRQVSSEAMGARPGNESRLDVSLYAIGRGELESLQQLQAANTRLQSLARDTDYIYRVSNGRWIWLTTAGNLPEFVHTLPWKSALLDRWSVQSNPSALTELTSQMEQRVRQLMGTHVPPLDLHTQADARRTLGSESCRPRLTKTRSGHARIDEAANSHASPNHLARPAVKWRYPI